MKKYEIYDIRNGRTCVENENTYQMTNMTRDEAETIVSQMLLNAYRSCESAKEEKFLNKHGIPYAVRIQGSNHRKNVDENIIEKWNHYYGEPNN